MTASGVAAGRPDLPTGTVTFLFSDIEGSTRLLQALGDRYPTLLEQQADLVRAAIAEGDGVEVGTEGDSFFVVFPTPAGAVRTAVAIQRSLAAATWPDGSDVKLRIGIHTGEGHRGGDDYVGLDVHRAARIAAVAHGGQVLLSAETEALSGRALPDGVDLRDLGHHRLKDLDREERIYQLVIDGLPADFPPIRSLDAGRSHLPEPLTSLVGRGRQVDEVVRLVEESRLVTLTGPGGTGKTRLAIGAAERLRPAFVDGAFFVALDLVRETSLVASVVAGELGLVETRDRTPTEALTEHLRDRSVLLVLDNFEQILEAAPLVDGWLKASPKVKVLVTSRRPLRLYGERPYAVPPLHLPDLSGAAAPDQLRESGAVALFVDRARMARPGFEPTDDELRAIGAIVTRLDGLPLAIELAAARIKVLSPGALLTRLEHRLAVLSSGTAGLPDRQRTLRGAIEWSHDSLPEPERILFRRLSVFAGGCRIEAVEAVCDAAGEIGGDALDLVSALIDDSLLTRDDTADGEPRFRLLETIREYAAEQLVAAGEALEMAGRHAAYMADLAEALEPRLMGADRDASLARLTAENDNIRAVMRWSSTDGDTTPGLRTAAAIWRFWQQRSQIREGRAWLTSLLAKPDAAAEPLVHARAVTAAGGLAYWQGDMADAGRSYEVALAIDRGLGDRARIGDDLRNLGFIAMATRDMPAAVRLFGEAVEQLEATGDRFALAEARASYGVSLALSGDAEAARGYLEASCAVMLELGVLPRAADNSNALGIIYRRLGDTTLAIAMSRQALEIVQGLGDAIRTPFMLDSAAALALERDRTVDAVRLASAAAHLRT
ncbi:MAG TPA: adenylate/guanylate cyclase domain-containing protein, partial [Candidatus Limnocylindrales bacterium]|nr:adenylate/guanylate cyclase domain-containing protein [Candidatus Limnocylindrales bacterium]